MGTENENAPEQRFGRYRVVERVGMGAMGDVYRAHDDRLDRDVAVKAIRTVARSEFQREMFQRRFENEARALAALSHPHIVNVFDVGVDDDTPFLVMELATGQSLAERLESGGPQAPQRVAELGRQIASALQAAHAADIVHRDVKPGNILEAGDGVWKLADFGVAHVPDSSLTLTGQFLGSPAYAAPESLERGDFGPPSDVFGLGVSLYEALTKTRPYGDDGVLSPGAMSTTSAPRPIGELRPDLPVHVADAITRAIERDPTRRCSAAELAELLEGRAAHAVPDVPVPGTSPSHRRAIAIAVGVALIVVGIAVGAGLSSSDDGDRDTPSIAPPAHPRDSVLGLPSISPHDDRDDRKKGKKHKKPKKNDAKKIEKEWKKVDKKLREGKERDALEHLGKILERDPDDRRALELFEQLTGEPWHDGD